MDESGEGCVDVEGPLFKELEGGRTWEVVGGRRRGRGRVTWEEGETGQVPRREPGTDSNLRTVTER